jgi:hypothetical protein
VTQSPLGRHTNSLLICGWLLKGNVASTIPVLSVIFGVVALSLGELNHESWDLCMTMEQWHGAVVCHGSLAATIEEQF